MTNAPILSLLILLPLLGAAAVALLPEARPRVCRAVAIGCTLLTAALVAIAMIRFDWNYGGLQFVERLPWIQSLNINYHLGIDGLGLLLVLLTVIITPLALSAPISKSTHPRLYLVLVLLLQAMAFGVFTAMNFVLWFLYWELTLIPAFLLIKLWGGPKRTNAAYQFFIYTFSGSIAMLIGFLAIHQATGLFDFPAIAALSRSGELERAIAVRFSDYLAPETISLGIFIAILLGVAVKVPLLPLHSWLPDTYTEAPSGVTMMLTGVLSKMGIYGFLRIVFPIFPAQLATAQPVLLWLAVATIVLPALAALAQSDIKRILAYSSINHLGYCLLAIFACAGATDELTGTHAAMGGTFLQIFNHGITAASLFLFVALLESRSGGLRSLNDFGGLRRCAPVFCGLMGISLFSSLGLPGLNGFAGEFLIFSGTFALTPWAAVAALPALLFTAIFLLRILARVFFGPINPQRVVFPDLTRRERLTLALPIALMFAIGISPNLILSFCNASIVEMLSLP